MNYLVQANMTRPVDLPQRCGAGHFLRLIEQEKLRKYFAEPVKLISITQHRNDFYEHIILVKEKIQNCSFASLQ